MAAWVWWRGEPAASLRSGGCKRAVDKVKRSGRRTCPKVFMGGWNRSNHWRGGFSLLPRSHPLAPSGRSPELGGLVSPTLSKGGMVASHRHLKEGIRSHGSAYTVRNHSWRLESEPLPSFVRVLPTGLPERATVRFLEPGLGGASPQTTARHRKSRTLNDGVGGTVRSS